MDTHKAGVGDADGDEGLRPIGDLEMALELIA